MNALGEIIATAAAISALSCALFVAWGLMRHREPDCAMEPAGETGWFCRRCGLYADCIDGLAPACPEDEA